ncbi:MAG: alpha/beta hydrolase [Phycisphaerae bacterium]
MLTKHLRVAAPLLALLLTAVAHADIKTGITYATPDNTPLKLDVGTPDGPGPFPVVLMIHGGGWSGGERAADFHQLYKPLNDAGIVWFTIDYRLAPQHRWPACFDDVNTALHWVHDHAAEYKGDPNRLAILGYSAGGHLAFLAATKTDIPLRAVVGLSPPTDLELDLPQRGGLSPSLQNLLDRPHELTPESRQILHDISPLHYLHKNMPPILILHGTADKSVLFQDSINWQKADEALGNSCEIIPLQGAPHRIRDWPKYLPNYEQQLADWLHKQHSAPQSTTQP